MKALRAFLILAFAATSIAPVAAQNQPEKKIPVAASIIVHVTNAANGSPVPSMPVYIFRTRGAGDLDSDFEYGATDESGTVRISGLMVPGTWTLEIPGGSYFDRLMTPFNISRGQTSYEVAYGLNPSRTAHPPIRLDQPRRLLIRVQGRLPNGQVVPVHYATIYNNKGQEVIMTGYDGTAVALHSVPLGEYAQLTAEAVNWDTVTESFISGASQSGSRLTRADDYINFMMGAKNKIAGDHAVEIRVRGRKNGELVPVHYATIYNSHGKKIAMTGYDGTGTGTVPDIPAGESYTLSAEANHWKNGTTSVVAQIKSNVTLNQPFRYILSEGNYRDTADFILDPEQPAEKSGLTVEVLDHATDKPIAGASVTLYKGAGFPGKAVTSGTSNSQGEVTFDSESMTAAREAGEAKVGAAHGGYAANTQSISSAELSGEHRFVVYLRAKHQGGGKYDLSGPWEFTWTWSVTSVDFVGTVSGGPGAYTFTGTVAGGGNAIWTAKTGSVTCTINAANPKSASMNCSASFPAGGTNGNGSTWTGQTTNGALSSYSDGKKKKFMYRGEHGHGQASGASPAGIDLYLLQPKSTP